MNMETKKGINLKHILILLISLFSFKAFSVCSSPLVRTSAGASTVLTSTRYNSDLNTAYNRLNNLPGDCIIDDTITSQKLASNSVTTAKIANSAVTAIKLADGAIPEAGRLLRISSFTSSGTWAMALDVGSIQVKLVGGGGGSHQASSTDGTSSSFGGHCVAGGGAKGTAGNGGAGGTASSGDVNLTGGSGLKSWASVTGAGGSSMFGGHGRGGFGGSSVGGGGGGGGYCSKYIRRENLSATEAVTIGAGGMNANTYGEPGGNGLVIIYEYSK